MIYFCCDDNRRSLVRKDLNNTGLNGIDYLEVCGAKTTTEDLRQRVLKVFFVRMVEDPLLTRLQAAPSSVAIEIEGGERITNVQVINASFEQRSNGDEEYFEITVDKRGDFSAYTLKLLESNSAEHLKGLDPELAEVDFSFKVECAGDFDCREVSACPPKVRDEPELDYLNKDYSSFRQLILDRMALIAPGWRERNPADLGMTLVEMLAYVGDHLSYRQDAIATEAYLGTARQRVSIRRHARLLDYPMHEGCNSRAWVQVRPNANAPTDGIVLPRNSALLESDPAKVTNTCFSTDAGVDCVLADDVDKLKQILDARAPEVFEPMHDVFLHPAHTEMSFYTWGEQQCCLPKGAVKAALAGHFTKMQPNHVLIFIERLGPKTGKEADADPTRRHAVRLTRATLCEDPVILRNNKPTPYTEIEWDIEDALPFPFCIRTFTNPNVSIVLGNIVLADHGYTLSTVKNLEAIPPKNPALAPAAEDGCGCCNEESPRVALQRFRPRLRDTGLTHAQALSKDFASSPAVRVTVQSPRKALPAIRLTDNHGDVWEPQRDLIGSDAFAREFVAEIENDGHARIRFGDDVNGMQPAEGTMFTARYRIGNGAQGNVGAGTIKQIFAPVLLDPDKLEILEGVNAAIIESITNPLPAWGGIEPETMEEVRQYAPQAFKEPRRCVTPEDYANRASQHPRVQRAAATTRWTGSWHTIFLTVDPRGGGDLTDEFKKELFAWLEPYRLAGHDLEIKGPTYVSLELFLSVCAADGYYRSDVKAALLDAFSTRQRSDGSRGFFHPDNFTFGDPVYVSAIYATAQRISGVKYVELRRLRRQGAKGGPEMPENGAFIPDKFEIVRLENDPNYPDHGLINLKLRGGR